MHDERSLALCSRHAYISLSRQTPTRFLTMPGPLKGISVIEFGGMGPGPFCAMQLGDMGASVIKIERAAQPTAASSAASRVTARGSRSIAIDMKKPGGVDAVKRLIAKSDVVIEGYRPGVMERLGLGPDVCLALQPRLVFGRMTGWGQTGPLAATAGHDINYIALTGALDAIGTHQRPVPPLNLVGDYGGGGMMLAYAVACALFHVKGGGMGQVIDMGMVDGASSLLAPIYGMKAGGRWPGARGENLLDGGAPFYGTYQCADGFMAVGAIEPQFFALLLDMLAIDPARYGEQHDRARWPAQRAMLGERFMQKTRAQWCALFDGTDACVAPVLSLAEAPGSAQAVARGTFIELDGVVQPAPPFRMSGTPCDMPAVPPMPGADTLDVLAAQGFSEDDIGQLVRSGAVKPGP